KEEPENPLLLLRYAEILLQLKRYPEAEGSFARVLALEYPSADLYNGLAAVYWGEDKTEKAKSMLEQAIQLHVADGETYYNLAEMNFREGNREVAMTYYDHSMM